jgi:polysaccharide pyruvyl transferase WcaK-like protein
LKEGKGRQKKIGIYGNFGSSNFGNEITFQTFLHCLRRRLPDAQVACICTDPELIAATHGIEAVPFGGTVAKFGNSRTRLARWLKRVIIEVPGELWQYIRAFKTLKGTDMLIIPGTGLLTDTCGLFAWGPYNLFKWSLMAKVRGCKVFFVSVGAGPVYGRLGRFLVKSALSLANFRSYRDHSSLKYVLGIGLRKDQDRVYPDLAFSWPEAFMPPDARKSRSRRVVGLGLMDYTGKYSTPEPDNTIYPAYLESLVVLVRWLLAKDYDIRLVIGDQCHRPVIHEFRSLLRTRLGTYDEERVIEEPISSVQELLLQLAATDLVVATAFHNVVLALLLNKPVISISFHHKCASLMEEMGLSEYCQDFNHLDAAKLIEQFKNLEKQAATLKPLIRQKVERFREALEEQYQLIFERS